MSACVPSTQLLAVPEFCHFATGTTYLNSSVNTFPQITPANSKGKCADSLNNLICHVLFPACDTRTLKPKYACDSLRITALEDCVAAPYFIDPFIINSFVKDFKENLSTETIDCAIDGYTDTQKHVDSNIFEACAFEKYAETFVAPCSPHWLSSTTPLYETYPKNGQYPTDIALSYMCDRSSIQEPAVLKTICRTEPAKQQSTVSAVSFREGDGNWEDAFGKAKSEKVFRTGCLKQDGSTCDGKWEFNTTNINCFHKDHPAKSTSFVELDVSTTSTAVEDAALPRIIFSYRSKKGDDVKSGLRFRINGILRMQGIGRVDALKEGVFASTLEFNKSYVMRWEYYSGDKPSSSNSEGAEIDMILLRNATFSAFEAIEAAEEVKEDPPESNHSLIVVVIVLVGGLVSIFTMKHYLSKTTAGFKQIEETHEFDEFVGQKASSSSENMKGFLDDESD